MKNRIRQLALILVLGLRVYAFGQDGVFTYQGRLASTDGPVNGPANMVFTLYGTATGGGAVWQEAHNAVSISNGLFSVSLGFETPVSGSLFDGSPRWLEIAVNGVPLSPRQPITATPYAIRAANFSGAVTDTQLSPNIARLDANQTFTGTVQFANASNTFSGMFTGDGSGLTSLNPGNLTNGTVPDAVLFWVSRIGALRMRPVQRAYGIDDFTSRLDLSANMIGGYYGSGEYGNSVADGVLGATISGGGLGEALCFRFEGCGEPLDTYINYVSADFGTVAGGLGNTSSGYAATVSGGFTNTSRNAYATVPGGHLNTAGGAYSFAAGRRAKALHDGSFVWGDSTDADIASSSSNQFVIRATGGARFVTAIDTNGTATAGVALAPGSGAWSTLSDRNAKTNFLTANSREILDKVAALPLATWSYKAQDSSIRHIGPTAQDFRAAFGVGENDRTITTVDADGVAFAAIQGLNELVKELAARLEIKNAEIQELKDRLSKLEALLRGQ